MDNNSNDRRSRDNSPQRVKEEKAAVASTKKRSRVVKTKDECNSPNLKRAKRASSTHRARTNSPAKEAFDLRREMKPPSNKNIYDEVTARQNESVVELQEKADRMVAEANENGTDDVEWKIDHLVGHSKDELMVVVKYAGFSIPSALELKPGKMKKTPGNAFGEYRERVTNIINPLIARLKVERGEAAFKVEYPNFYAIKETGFGESTFIENELNKHMNLVRAYESALTAEADRVHQPPLFVVDATGTMADLPNFTFSAKMIPSEKVRRGMNNSSEFSAIVCNVKCDKAKPCESFVKLNRKETEHRNCKCKIMKREGRMDTGPVECIDRCNCDPETCANRVIQRGRQIPLIIFQDNRKGWTLRAACDIKKGQFVSEYIGEVLTHYEAAMREDGTYLMNMCNNRSMDCLDEEEEDERVHKVLVIDALKYGNETRFISHSCTPNLVVVNSYVERVGGWFNRMAFVANRNIKAGEELTFDYFPDKKLKTRFENYNPLFKHCLCDSGEECHFPELEGEFARLQEESLNGTARKQDKKQAEKEGDSWSEDMPIAVKSEVVTRGERLKKREDVKEQMMQEEALAVFAQENQEAEEVENAEMREEKEEEVDENAETREEKEDKDDEEQMNVE